jgi:ribosomal protein L35AE/L33A
MPVLRIEHPVPDFDAWKKEGFDSDPVGRQQGGVRSHRVLRDVDDPNYVMIDLEFDTPDAAEAFLSQLRGLWSRVEGTIMTSPQARIVEAVETQEY